MLIKVLNDLYRKNIKNVLMYITCNEIIYKEPYKLTVKATQWKNEQRI